MQGLDFRARTILAGVREDFQSGATQLALNTLDELLSYLDDTKPGVEALYRLLAEIRAAAQYDRDWQCPGHDRTAVGQ